MFDDSALQCLISTALAQNYNAHLVLALVAEAWTAVELSRYFWLPQVGGTARERRDNISLIQVEFLSE